VGVPVLAPHIQRRAVRRLLRNSAIVLGLVTMALGIGAAGYHYLDDLPWLDATLNASMILTGMGPVNPVVRPEAKVFATVYALFSGVFFLTMVAVLLAPAAHLFLHRFHLEFEESTRAEQAGSEDPASVRGDSIRTEAGAPHTEAGPSGPAGV